MEQIDALGFNLADPAFTPVLAPTHPGSLPIGTYQYVATYHGAFGDSLVSPAASITTTFIGAVQVSGWPSFMNNVSNVKLYRTRAGGTMFRQVANINILNTPFFIDTVLDANLGSGMPNTIPDDGDSNSLMLGKFTFNGKTIFENDISVSGNVASIPNTANFPAPYQGVSHENTGYTNKSQISSLTAGSLAVSQIPITSGGDSKTSSFGTTSTDGTYMYLTTQGLSGTSPAASNDSYITCINVATNTIVWKRLMSSYSGIAGDETRCAPTIYGNYIYFGSSINLPQTFSPYINVVARFTGVPAVATGRPPRLYCVDKRTGDLVWETVIGRTAAVITDLDNWMNITSAPTVAEIDIHGIGITTPVVITGTSSGQSFQPWLLCPNASPFGLSLGTLPAFQMTDNGKIVILNALTGEILKTYIMGKTYTAGDIVHAAELFVAPQTSIDIHHFVVPADIAPAGILNSASPDFPSSCMWLLSGAVQAPAMLQGKTFSDNTGIMSVIPVAAPAGANFDGVAIEINVTFKPSTNQILYLATLYLANATQLLDGTGGLRQARIVVQLVDGHVMTAWEAYQCSWWGASTWAGSVATANEAGNLTKGIYMCCGQNHGIPLFESELFLGSGNWIPTTQAIRAAQDAYHATPNPTTFAAIQTAYTTGDNSIDSRLLITKSASGQLNYANSIVRVRLDGAGAFTLDWHYKAIAYDNWHIGYILDAKRKTAQGGTPLPGYVGIQTFYGHPAGADSDFACGTIYDATNNIVMACNKGGLVFVVNLTGGPTVHRRRLCNGGTEGGANYGASYDGQYLYVVELNTTANGAINADPALGGTLPQDFAPLLSWFLPDTTEIPTDNSVLVKYDVINDIIMWTVRITPETPTIVTAAMTRTVNDITFVIDGLGKLKGFNTANGAIVSSNTLEAAGQTGITVLNNKIYIFPARAGLGQYYPASTGYHDGKYLYCLSL